MEFLAELYVGESIENIGTVIYSLKRGIPVFRLYCIVLFGGRNRIEILSSKELFTKKYENRQKTLLGVAMGKREAYRLLAYMAEDAAKAGKDMINPALWFMEEEKEGVSS